MGQKTKRVISIEGGLMLKPTAIDIEGVGGTGNIVPSGEPEKEFCRALVKRTGFKFIRGKFDHISWGGSDRVKIDNTGGIEVPVDRSSKGSGVYYVSHEDSATAAHYGKNSDGTDMVSQTAGVVHYVRSYNNTQKNSGNNGYTLTYLTTTKDDPFEGASPMPIIGLTFRVWCIRGTKWWYGGNEIFTDKEVSADCFINRMWLVYIKPDGVIYNVPVLPEGSNSGSLPFVNQDNLSAGYNKGNKGYQQKAFVPCRSMYSAKQYRVWHNQPIPDGHCFAGFVINWGIGTIADVDKKHNLTFGGFAPIFKEDLSYIQANDKEVKPSHTTFAYQPLKNKADLYNIYPELNNDNDTKVKSRRLWTVSDPNTENDHGTTKNNYKSKSGYYHTSWSLKARNMTKWDKDK